MSSTFEAVCFEAFGISQSRVDLVDAICDTFAANPALRELREAVEIADPEEALAETVAFATAFWASEDAVLGSAERDIAKTLQASARTLLLDEARCEIHRRRTRQKVVEVGDRLRKGGRPCR